jgi:hypothetical protein
MSLSAAGLRYLCLTDKFQLETDIDTWWSRIVGDRTTWGPGFDGWDPALTMDLNVYRRFGRLEEFDAVFLSHSYSSLAVRHTPPSAAFLGNKPTVVLLHEVLAVEEFDPFRTRSPICDVSAIDIVLHAYAESEMDPYYASRAKARVDDGKSRLATQTIEHVQHHVRSDLFSTPETGDTPRDIDVLLVGRCHTPLYPLRARWAQLIKDEHWKSALHFETPYGRQHTWTDAERSKQQQDYANVLKRARIVLCCSSYWRYMLGKYTEIAASGAFIISDVPTHMPLEFIENMGVVSAQMTDEELVQVVNGWLEASDESRSHAAHLGEYVRGHMGMQDFWAKVDNAVMRWKTGYEGTAVTAAPSGIK